MYYYTSILNQSFVKSTLYQFPNNPILGYIIDTIKAAMFDAGISSIDPYVIWHYDGKEIKSILTNSPSLQDYEEEQYTNQEKLDFVEGLNNESETY